MVGTGNGAGLLSGPSANLDKRRTGAYFARSNGGLFGNVFSLLSFYVFFILSLGDPIRTEILS